MENKSTSWVVLRYKENDLFKLKKSHNTRGSSNLQLLQNMILLVRAVHSVTQVYWNLTGLQFSECNYRTLA